MTGQHPLAIFVTGVAGCGKSTVGRLLAERLHAPFLEGDDFHGPANVAKMASGTPLTDEDRWPWLDRLAAAASAAAAGGAPVIVSCSALRRAYRARLEAALPGPAAFVQLAVDRAEIERRLAARTDHFMPPALIASQFDALEPLDPAPLAFALNAALPVETLCDAIMGQLALDR